MRKRNQAEVVLRAWQHEPDCPAVNGEGARSCVCAPRYREYHQGHDAETVADLQRRLDEALQVLSDLREERGLEDFRAWLAEQWRHGVEGISTNPLAGHITADVMSVVAAEFDRRFGAKP